MSHRREFTRSSLSARDLGQAHIECWSRLVCQTVTSVLSASERALFLRPSFKFLQNYRKMEDYAESQSNKLTRKIAENPFMPVGILGLVGACGYGAYQYKNKGKMSTSVYLMRLRVVAQSYVVGSLCIGVAYHLINEHVLNKK